jgi:cytochrome b involved in lipid metabolism
MSISGGKNAIMMYAGKDASRHFNIVHMKDVIARYAPETIIGVLVQRQ